MFKDDSARLRHILEAAQEALSYVRHKTRNDLDSNRQLVLSLVKLLEILGEAAAGISPEFRQKYPNIP